MAPIYIDAGAKGLSIIGILVLILGQGNWFIAGLFLVTAGVLLGAWEIVVARRVRSPQGPARPLPFAPRLSKRNPSDEEQSSTPEA